LEDLTLLIVPKSLFQSPLLEYASDVEQRHPVVPREAEVNFYSWKDL
jgi:hypothetical protein